MKVPAWSEEMAFKKVSLAVAAVAMASAPAIAQVSMSPAVAPFSGDESEAGSGTAVILGLLGAAAIVGGIILVSDDNDNDIPVSG